MNKQQAIIEAMYNIQCEYNQDSKLFQKDERFIKLSEVLGYPKRKIQSVHTIRDI